MTRQDRVDSEAASNLLVFGPAFARQRLFWAGCLTVAFIGAALGLMAWAFFWAVNLIQANWLSSNSYDNLVVSSKLEHRTEYIVVPLVGGFVIGILKILPLGALSYPPRVHGFFRKVSDLYVHPNHAPVVVLAAIISLGCGGSVGPEAALGWIGGALANLLVPVIRRHLEIDPRQVTMDAIIAAISSICPTPILAVILLHELQLAAGSTVFTQHYMERIATGLVAGIAANVVSQELFKHDTVPIFGFPSEDNWGEIPHSGTTTVIPTRTDSVPLRAYGTAALLGIVSGIIGLLVLLVMGIFRAIGARVSARMRDNGRETLGKVLLPTVAGLIVGCVGYALPLTFGDGSYQIKYIVEGFYKGNYSTSYLVQTAFAKMFLLAVCQGFGFVGGQILPCITIGFYCSLVVNNLFNTELSIVMPCMMCAVPSAFVPAPLFFIFLVTTLSALDGIRISLVATAVVVSFLTNCGFGVIQFVLERKIAIDAASQDGSSHEGRASLRRLSGEVRFSTIIEEALFFDQFTSGESLVAGPNDIFHDLSSTLFGPHDAPGSSGYRGNESSFNPAAHVPREGEKDQEVPEGPGRGVGEDQFHNSL